MFDGKLRLAGVVDRWRAITSHMSKSNTRADYYSDCMDIAISDVPD